MGSTRRQDFHYRLHLGNSQHRQHVADTHRQDSLTGKTHSDERHLRQRGKRESPTATSPTIGHTTCVERKKDQRRTSNGHAGCGCYCRLLSNTAPYPPIQPTEPIADPHFSHLQLLIANASQRGQRDQRSIQVLYPGTLSIRQLDSKVTDLCQTPSKVIDLRQTRHQTHESAVLVGRILRVNREPTEPLSTRSSIRSLCGTSNSLESGR